MSETNIDDHKCLCEKCFCKCNHPCCCVNMNDCFDSLKTYENGKKYGDDVCLCTFVCCPFKFPLALLFFLPCTMYNICRNKCNNTDNKNYLF